MLTGESLPVTKMEGSMIFSGTKNITNKIAAKVEKMTDVRGKMFLYIVKDPYFGPLIGVTLNREDEIDTGEKYPFEKERERHTSAIRLTPLTDVEAEDMVNALLNTITIQKNLRRN